MQFISTAFAFNALGHIIHQRKENVLLFYASHSGCNIGLCFTVKISPLFSYFFKDDFHVAPVVFLIHQRNINLRQRLCDIIDLCFVFLIISCLLDLMQTGDDCVECGTNCPRFLTGRFRYCSNVRRQPFHGHAECTGRSSSLLHGFTNFLTGCRGIIADVQEYVRHTFRSSSSIFKLIIKKPHRVYNCGNNLRRVFKFNIRCLRIHSYILQTVFNVLNSKALTCKVNCRVCHVKRTNAHLLRNITIPVCKLRYFLIAL